MEWNRKKSQAAQERRSQIKNRLSYAASKNVEELYQYFHTSASGLAEEQVEKARENFGDNVVTYGKKESPVSYTHLDVYKRQPFLLLHI